jgi:hypothetical protein
MTDYFEELVADLNAIGVEVEKAKMSRSEAGRVAANARWGNKGGAPKMVDWRTAAGISPAEQKSNARSKAGMQGARTRAQNKEANTRTPGSIQAEMERAGVPKKTIDAITKNPLGSASAKASAAHIKRMKDVNGLSSNQKTKYNEKMDMATPGMSPDMKHQDAIVYALDAKAARPRAEAARAAAEARFAPSGMAAKINAKNLEQRLKNDEWKNPADIARVKEKIAGLKAEGSKKPSSSVMTTDAGTKVNVSAGSEEGFRAFQEQAKAKKAADKKKRALKRAQNKAK